ncbi:DUF4292 domain-containing protein [Niabella ginsengisoli]|uniref:DUF4292 domain-containing protein n=1 Tax=Niabella ginsengisoli TaxID=522298 RepID=A0ABS9SLV5_9BACT|nr:DUF4292 domain-containing protein [Niabella ginsengisoli]MCH5599330.1 DUF4292 domain-containing protein [Niabella ginsengisoli]
MKKIIIIASIAALASCNASKKAAKTPTPETPTPVARVEDESPTAVLSKLNTIDFKTFSGKVDVDFDDGKGNGKSVSAKLVIKKDEAIWMSAGLMGFEGVRALITKDSVKILNKLQKEYIATSLTYLQEKIGLPVDFTTLQNLLIGNPVFVSTTNASLVKEGDNYVITTQDANFKNLLTVLMPGYLPSVSKLSDVDATKNRSAELAYNNYKSVAGRNFSTTRNIGVKYKSNITIKLDFKSHDFDGEVSIPFSVPSGYKTKQ